MKSVEILIPNRNSAEALELCVESVRAHTRARPYGIIVYDDASTNDMDIPYLREAQRKGWLRLYEGRRHIGHGAALNALVNHFCRADYAVILDSDIEILRDGWLEDLIACLAVKPNLLAVVRTHKARERGRNGEDRQWWLAPFSEFWFGIINMGLYRADMRVDWRPRVITDKAEMRQLYNAWQLPVAKMERYILDVGCKLFHRLCSEPKQKYHYETVLPEHVKTSFRHFRQISSLAESQAKPELEQYMSAARRRMQKELAELRKMDSKPHPYGTVNPYNLSRAADAVLNEVLDIAASLGFGACLAFGTCLGFYRDGGYIDGDNDLDIVVNVSGEDEQNAFIAAMERHGYGVGSFVPILRNRHFFKDSILVDVFWRKPGGFYCDFGTVERNGKAYPVPNRIEEYLAACYSNWREPMEESARYYE